MLNFQPTIKLGNVDTCSSRAEENDYAKQDWLTRKTSSVFVLCDCGTAVLTGSNKNCPVCGGYLHDAAISTVYPGLDNVRSHILASRQAYMLAA